tara:strand:- start:1200 stop:1307 length:108 start_codon:yes stop_codon:yes gene_type:complete
MQTGTSTAARIKQIWDFYPEPTVGTQPDANLISFA